MKNHLGRTGNSGGDILPLQTQKDISSTNVILDVHADFKQLFCVTFTFKATLLPKQM